MAHNARVRPPGDWINELLPAECLALDQLQFGSLSKRGGAWAPVDPIEIGGAQGLEVTGPSYVDRVVSVELASGVSVEYDSYIVEREHCVSPGTGTDFAVMQVFYNVSTGFFIGSADSPVLIQTEAELTPTLTPRWWIPLHLPVGSVLTKLAITLSAGYAHADNDGYDDALPKSMPRLALARADHDDGAQHFGTPVFDASASLEVYRESHDLEVTTISSPTYDGTQLWWAVIDGEYGEHARAGLYVSSARTTVIQTTHDEFQI